MGFPKTEEKSSADINHILPGTIYNPVADLGEGPTGHTPHFW